VHGVVFDVKPNAGSLALVVPIPVGPVVRVKVVDVSMSGKDLPPEVRRNWWDVQLEDATDTELSTISSARA
jgi:hypothetical protein